jgi:hypothetical protein
MSYANVAATLALVFSTTGGALAANHYLVNSTKQINPKVLKQLRGHNGKAGGPGPQGGKGDPGAPGAKGERGERGANGATGRQGVTGSNGANGATNVAVRYTEVATEGFNEGEAIAHCASGERATGGGVAETTGGSPEHIYYYKPGGVPFPETYGATPAGWDARWYNGTALTTVFRVSVVCASP